MKKLLLITLFALFTLVSFGQRHTIDQSSNVGYFMIDSVDYPKGHFAINYTGRINVDTLRKFTLFNIHSGEKMITSRYFNQVSGVTSWDELSELLESVEAINKITGVNLVDTSGRMARLDPSTNAQITIDYPHHELHNGKLWSICITNLNLGINDTMSISFKVDSSAARLHVVALVDNTSKSFYEMLEAPTITLDSGTEILAKNRRRDSPNIIGIGSIETISVSGYASVNATITDDGTVIDEEGIGAGNNKLAGSSRSTAEWILDTDKIYSFRLVGLAVSGNANIQLVIYEHTDKEVIN